MGVTVSALGAGIMRPQGDHDRPLGNWRIPHSVLLGILLVDDDLEFVGGKV
jgi:hypothetical protein